MTNLKKLQLQQRVLEETFMALAEQQQASTELMHDILIKNRQILEGIDPFETEQLPEIQVEDEPEPEDPFFVGMQLSVNGFQATISSVDKHSLGAKAIVTKLDGVSTSIQDIVISRDLALAALKAQDDALLAKDDLRGDHK